MFLLSASVQVSDAVKKVKLNSTEREVHAKTDNKTKMVAMRFRESDYETIKKKADKAKMNFTEFVTRSALDKPIIIIDGLDKVLKEQKAIGRNLNQLTMLCNMGKIVCPDLSEMIDRYSAAYDRLNDISGRCR